MFRRLATPIAALLMSVTPLVSGATINFPLDNFSYGSQIGEFYNGGYDSLGRLGVDYGISFKNESIKYTPRGAYLSGRVEMTLDAEVIRSILGTDQYYVAFNATRYDRDGNFAFVNYEDGFLDAFWINGAPYCSQRITCDFPFPYVSMDSYVTYAGGTSSPVHISFSTDRLDNIEIRSLTGSQTPIRLPQIMGSVELDRDIPEPASLALFSAGAAALLARRRKRVSVA